MLRYVRLHHFSLSATFLLKNLHPCCNTYPAVYAKDLAFKMYFQQQIINS